jgi:protein TonB
MSSSERFAPTGNMHRNAVITGSVLALHVAGIWALQHALTTLPSR